MTPIIGLIHIGMHCICLIIYNNKVHEKKSATASHLLRNVIHLKLSDNKEYGIRGFHFFNRSYSQFEFDPDMKRI